MGSGRLSVICGLASAMVLLTVGLVLGARPAPAQDSVAPAAGSRIEPASPSREARVPDNPVAAAAYAVMEKHCARCHQGGRLERPAPAAAFGNILRLDALAEAPHLVRPGNPDASRLYHSLLRRHSPLDAHGDSPPTSEEIAAVRSWISGLPPVQPCRDRRLVTPGDHAATLSRLTGLTAEPPGKLRFVSIAHLHNGCVPLDALAAYRQAVVHLFNSLSWKVTPVAVPPIDVDRTLFKINLDDLGWLPEHWERIMRSGGEPLASASSLPVEATRKFGTATPVAPADWLAETVMNAPLYYDVLGLPGSGPEILEILDPSKPQLEPSGSGARSIVAPSWFASGPSWVERRSARAGAIWQSFHRKTGDEAPDAAALAAPGVSGQPPHLASRIMFTLPNGLPAFFALGRGGERLDVLPPDMARREATNRGSVRSGLDCLSCHRAGVARDPDRAGHSKPLANALTADRVAIMAAMRRIGLDPGLSLDGVAPIVALAQEYAHPLDDMRAAAELGVELDALRNLADSGDNPAAILARRLVQGLVPRVEMEAHARDLLQALGRSVPARSGGDNPARSPVSDTQSASHAVDPRPGLVLYSDKTRYRKGEPLHLVVRVALACHLTVIGIDTRGRGTVIFPSDFETATLLTAGQELKLPADGAGYTFRLNDAGRETIVALCNETGALTDGIRHDFERQRFTDLGDYAAFLSQNALSDPGKTEMPRSGTEAIRRARGRAPSEGPSETAARPDQITRTAITIVVE